MQHKWMIAHVSAYKEDHECIQAQIQELLVLKLKGLRVNQTHA